VSTQSSGAFFSSLIIERTAAKIYRTRDAARAGAFGHIERFLGPRRLYWTLGYVSSVKCENQRRSALRNLYRTIGRTKC
jgi:hypothetical protein